VGVRLFVGYKCCPSSHSSSLLYTKPTNIAIVITVNNVIISKRVCWQLTNCILPEQPIFSDSGSVGSSSARCR
jgi:hypothetical protein